MKCLALSTVIVLSCLICVQCQSIRKIINDRQDLTTLERLIGMTELYEEFDKPGTMTFFAPNDNAFRNISAEIIHKYSANSQSAREEFDQLMAYHTVLGQHNIANLRGKSSLPSIASGEPKLFITRNNMTSSVYVNGAKIVQADQPAVNGMVHIVDKLIYPLGNPVSAWKYVENQIQNTDVAVKTSYFFQLLNAYKNKFGRGSKAYNYLNSNQGMATLFVPPDSVFERNELKKRFKQLKDSNIYLKKMIEAHIMPDAVMHTGVLREYLDKNLPGIESTFTPKQFGSDILVSSGCVTGKLHPKKSNITVSNGVVHFVDTTFGFVYNDAFGEIKEDGALSSFEYLAKLADDSLRSKIELPVGFTGDVPDKDKVTIFAPINNAFPRRSLEIGDISQNATATALVLQMSVIDGKALQMRDLVRLSPQQTLRPGFKARFFKDEQGDTWVDVDHVRGRIVKSDVCVRNGVIHHVSHVLGHPFRTIELFVKHMPDYSDLWSALTDTAYNVYVGSKYRKVTMFVPNNEAFRLMREDSQGRKFFDSFNEGNLRNLLTKHLIQDEVFLDLRNIGERGIQLQTKLDKEEITVLRRNNKYFVQYGSQFEAEIIAADMRMENGVVHVVNRVLYSDRLDAKEWRYTSSATVCHLQRLLLTALMLLHILLII